MMTRKALTILLLFISWPVNNIHRLLNNHQEVWGYWYPFNPSCKEELQWHIHSIFESVSYLCIFIALRLYTQTFKRKDRDIDDIFCSFLIIQVIDLFHYIGWHRRSEIILVLEGTIMLYAALKIFLKNRKTN